MRVLTIGHSAREPMVFMDLLRRHGVQRVVDVRSVPRSRRVRWSGADALPKILADAGVAYAHLPELGGLRKPRPDSVNGAWRDEGLRGYADHMATAEFARGVDALLAMAAREQVAAMCAEALPQKCHRSLLSDALVARGVEVAHVLDARLEPHATTPSARVVDGLVTYPPAGGRQARLGG